MRCGVACFSALVLLACGPGTPDEAGDGGPSSDGASSESTSDGSTGSSDSTGTSAGSSTSTDSSDTDSLDCVEDRVTVEAQSDCTLDLHETRLGPPLDVQIPFVEVEQDGVLVPHPDDCASEDGWTWLVEGETMSLCGSWCESLAQGDVFDVTYRCPPLG
jgi:hypothetical protein